MCICIYVGVCVYLYVCVYIEHCCATRLKEVHVDYADVCVYMYIYIYIYIYAYIFIYIHIYISTHTYKSVWRLNVLHLKYVREFAQRLNGLFKTKLQVTPTYA